MPQEIPADAVQQVAQSGNWEINERMTPPPPCNLSVWRWATDLWSTGKQLQRVEEGRLTSGACYSNKSRRPLPLQAHPVTFGLLSSLQQGQLAWLVHTVICGPSECRIQWGYKGRVLCLCKNAELLILNRQQSVILEHNLFTQLMINSFYLSCFSIDFVLLSFRHTTLKWIVIDCCWKTWATFSPFAVGYNTAKRGR